jgi:S1-C subfamily serine protease
VFDGLTPTRVRDVAPPDEALAVHPIVAQVAESVVKVRGSAPSCSRRIEGSGFVYEPGYVMTNAHVVAGTNEVTVEAGDRRLRARVVHYDPETDVAVLAVPGLSAPALQFSLQDGTSGQDSIVLGYPLDGPYTAAPSRIRDRISLSGPNIYGSRTVTRDVFTLRSVVKSGNSGGPLVDTEGQVIGVVFGAAVDNSDTGFALTADQVRDEVDRASSMTDQVTTGRCAD